MFAEERLFEDEKTELEVPPKDLQVLSGMGASASDDGYQGKYEGFGNSPISKGICILHTSTKQ